MPSKGNVQAAARAAVGNVSEYGRAFEGGAGRDIRMEGFVRVGEGQPGTPVIGPVGPRKAMLPVLLILVVVFLAS